MKMPSLLCGLMLAAVLPGALAAEDPDAVFDRCVAAVHAGDTSAVRALIAPDVELSDFVGCRAEMDNVTCLVYCVEATVAGPKARFTERERRVDGDTLTATLKVRSPLYTKAGVERIFGRDVVTVRDGWIRAFRFAPDFADEPTTLFFATLGIGPRAPNAAAPRP